MIRSIAARTWIAATCICRYSPPDRTSGLSTGQSARVP